MSVFEHGAHVTSVVLGLDMRITLRAVRAQRILDTLVGGRF